MCKRALIDLMRFAGPEDEMKIVTILDRRNRALKHLALVEIRPHNSWCDPTTYA